MNATQTNEPKTNWERELLFAVLGITVLCLFYWMLGNRAYTSGVCTWEETITIRKTWSATEYRHTEYYAASSEGKTYHLLNEEQFGQLQEDKTYQFTFDKCMGQLLPDTTPTNIKELD